MVPSKLRPELKEKLARKINEVMQAEGKACVKAQRPKHGAGACESSVRLEHGSWRGKLGSHQSFDLTLQKWEPTESF